VDFAKDLFAFDFGYAFQHRLADALFVKLTLDYCEIPAPVFQLFSLSAIGWMVMALEV
jgi:hypothetical protein